MKAIINFLFAIMAIMAAAGCGVMVLAKKMLALQDNLTPCCKRRPVESGYGYPLVRCPMCDKLYSIEED